MLEAENCGFRAYEHCSRNKNWPSAGKILLQFGSEVEKDARVTFGSSKSLEFRGAGTSGNSKCEVADSLQSSEHRLKATFLREHVPRILDWQRDRVWLDEVAVWDARGERPAIFVQIPDEQRSRKDVRHTQLRRRRVRFNQVNSSFVI